MSRTGAVALAVVMLWTAAPGARADPRTELEQARGLLSSLEQQISSEELVVRGLQTRLLDLTARLGQQEVDFGLIRREMRATESKLVAAEAELTSVRDQIGRRARHMYMYGPLSWLDLLLGSRSQRDLAAYTGYAGRVLDHDARLADRAKRLGVELRDAQVGQERLLREEAVKLAALRRERNEIQSVVFEQQERLDNLARTRATTQDLVRTLQGRIAAESLGPALRAAGRGMPITFGEWAEAFLGALGAPVSRPNQVAVVAWQTAEYTEATWNPLATTYAMPDTTVFNSHGVRNFNSKEQGIEASIRTLRRPNRSYEPVIANLMAGTDAMATARAINASMWCRGCANGNYVIGLIPAVEAYYERYATG
jgi:peptidoglycan hydrolase CwlO-like protein